MLQYSGILWHSWISLFKGVVFLSSRKVSETEYFFNKINKGLEQKDPCLTIITPYSCVRNVSHSQSYVHTNVSLALSHVQAVARPYS